MEDKPKGWRKSSRSQNGANNCILLSRPTGSSEDFAGDSKHPGGPVLTFGRAAMESFLARAKSL